MPDTRLACQSPVGHARHLFELLIASDSCVMFFSSDFIQFDGAIFNYYILVEDSLA
jgi:hypothetical protein